MCIAPNILANGQPVACHECWQCREQAINDWVGRNIAESKTAIACHAVTLTYGRSRSGDADHERANVLTYSDVQKYLKLLRRHGYPVRYFVTGEFGSKKGRAHWHIMLYWLERVPENIVLDQNFMERHWPHGWSFWTKPSHNAIRYNCKYIQKDMGDAERQGHLAMSKKPPLGTAYFERLAEKYVAQGLSPQSLEYTFPEVRRRKQDGSEEVVVFRLKDTPAERFIEHFRTKWRERYGDKPYPPSRMIEEALDPDKRKRRVILERFAELPPLGSLNARQRLQVDHDRAALAALDQPEGNLPRPREFKPMTGCDRIAALNKFLYRQQYAAWSGVDWDWRQHG